MLFISYSRAEIEATKRIEDELLRRGIECWLDESNIPVGEAFVTQLGDALNQADSFLLLDTPASRDSYWVLREVMTAMRYRCEGRFHTVFRIYSAGSADCIHSKWDAALLLRDDALETSAELISRRSSLVETTPATENIADVLIESGGLGQPSNWMGRQDELRILDEWWFQPSRGAWVHGVGGIGKSGLVQTWIAALAHLGYQDRVKASVLYIAGREITETVSMMRKLAEWHSGAHNRSKLLFVDGYDEATPGTDTETFLQRVLTCKGRVIVTSRVKPPPSLAHFFQDISLDAMSRRDSTSVLAEMGISVPEREVAALQFGDHPLALKLFAKYIESSKRSAADALKGLSSPWQAQFGGTLRATLAASIGALTTNARQLFAALCKVSDHGVVSLGEFGDLRKLARSGTLRELVRANLIQVDDSDTPTTVAINPLLCHLVEDGPGAVMEGPD